MVAYKEHLHPTFNTTHIASTMNERSGNTQGAIYPPVSQHWMTPKQARYGARVALLVLGLISVVFVFGMGASFSMQKKDFKLRMGTDPLEGTVLEPDFGKARMLEDEDSGDDDDNHYDNDDENDDEFS